MKLIVAPIILTLLFSCTKFGKTYRVKGKVINPITGEGFAGAEVSLSRNTIGIPGGSKVQKTVKTDENGNFDISKLAVRNDGVAVLGLANSEFDIYRIGWTIDGGKTFALGMGAKFGKTIHADYYAVPYGELKYTINNINCFDVTDTLVITTTYQIPSAFYDENLNTSTYLGCFQYFGNVYSKLPMGWHFFEGFYKKNNISTIFKDSIYITENGYHEWIFEY